MSAHELRQAAETLRGRAEVATPGKWHAFGQNIGVTVKGCTCAGTAPGYPQHESHCGIDGPIVEGFEQDIAYIATMHPGVGLALADWLDWTYDQDHSGDMDDNGCDECAPAIRLARLINGGVA